MNQILSLLLALLPLTSFARTSQDSIGRLVETINKFNRAFPQEKIYLHIDNTSYFMGETMWVKAYLTTYADTAVASSSIGYVELLDPQGNVVKTLKLKFVNGVAHGEIKLDGLYRSGFYEVRAWTRYMLNWGSDAVFSRVIPIFDVPQREGDYSYPVIHDDTGNRLIPSQRQAENTGFTETHGGLSVRFYPEGGSSIIGHVSTVAFTIADNSGRPIAAECDLMSGGKVTNVCRTDSDGRGTLTYTPTSIPARLTVLHDSKKQFFELPKAEASGCALHVDMLNGDTVTISVSTPGLEGMTIGVAMISDGKIYYCRELRGGAAATLTIDRNDLAEGVSQLTVINGRGDILATRMLFVYPHTAMAPVSVDEASLKGRQLNVRLKTLPGAKLSVAVRDADTQSGDWQQNAATWLLLSSDLRGYIAHPDYYLESDDHEHRRAADLLMLVQGWRRYDIHLMEGCDTFVMRQPMEQKMLLSGCVLPVRKNVNVKDLDLDVVLQGYGQTLTGHTETGTDGSYAFAVPDCYGDNFDLSIRASTDDKNQNVRIGIKRHFSPQGRAITWMERQQTSRQSPTLYMADIDNDTTSILLPDTVYLLPQVDVNRRRQRAMGFWHREQTGADRSTIMYDCERDADALLDTGRPLPSLVEYLRNKNPLVTGNDNVSGFSGYRNWRYNLLDDGPSYGRRPIVWIVDNDFVCATSVPHRYAAAPTATETMQEDGLYAIPTSLDEVRRVYVDTEAKRMNSWADFLGNQTVTFYVYTHGGRTAKSAKGIRRTHFQGLHTPKTYEEENMPLPEWPFDHRRTLYWNPDITTDSQGHATIELMTNATATGIVISAEGFATDGTVLCSSAGRTDIGK